MSKPRSFDLFRVAEEAAKAVVEGVPPGVARQTVEPEPPQCDCWCGKLSLPTNTPSKCSSKVESNIENVPLCSWCWANHQPTATEE